MKWYLAPALVTMRDEANRRWPDRSRLSDGTIGDTAHASRTSDHNPKPDGKGGYVVDAFDLTDDPANGCCAHVLAEQVRLRRDIRVRYIISRSRICGPSPIAGYPAWAWRPYSGANPHDKHVHFSIHASSRGDTSPWFASPEPAPPWKWSNHMPGPLEFTSAAVCPSGGYWRQTAEGGIHADDGAPYCGAYNQHAKLGGNVRYFVALVATTSGGYIQVANDGGHYRWDPK